MSLTLVIANWRSVKRRAKSSRKRFERESQMLRDLPMMPVPNGHAANGLVPFSVSQARKEAALTMLEAELVVELPSTPVAMNGYGALLKRPSQPK